MAMMRLPQSIARPAPLIRGRYSAAALHRCSNCFHRSAAASHQLAYQTHDMSLCNRSLSFCNLSTNQYYANFTLSRNFDAWELHSNRVRSLSSTTTDGDTKVLNQVRTSHVCSFNSLISPSSNKHNLSISLLWTANCIPCRFGRYYKSRAITKSNARRCYYAQPKRNSTRY